MCDTDMNEGDALTSAAVEALLEELERRLVERQQIQFDRIEQKVDHIERKLAISQIKDCYTVEEVAEKIGRSPWTVRQWCNRGQVHGAKKIHGKGRQGEWRISREGVQRLESEGPLRLGAAAA